MNDMFMHVPGTLWDKLGTTFTKDDTAKTSYDIVKQAKLDFTVSAHPMGCDLATQVKGYHAVYRDDCNQLLGVVNTQYPEFVQNINSFTIMENLISKNIVNAETVSSYNVGQSIFCIFPVNQPYKLIDDEVKHYFIVVNDHLKPDGKVLVLNTPVRIVCQNALSYALTKSIYSARLPVFEKVESMNYLSDQLLQSADIAVAQLNKRAEKMLKQKVSQTGVDKVLNTLFPFVPSDDDNEHVRANDAIDLARTTFLNDCVHADNLANYNGTVYQLYNGLTDFIQHYFKDGTKGYDLNHKITLLPGIGTTDSKVGLVKKLLAMSSEIAA